MAMRYIDKKRFKGQTSAFLENGLLPSSSQRLAKPLTMAQQIKMKQHAKKYSPQHIRMMKDLMRQGLTFEQAHRRLAYLP